MDAKKREGRTTLFLESTVEDLMVDSFLTGRSLRHNCVQIFNIISCFISDTPWLERYSKKRRERREIREHLVKHRPSCSAISKLASF